MCTCTCIFAYKMSHVPSTDGVPRWLYLASPRQTQSMEISGQMNVSTQLTGHRKPSCTASGLPACLPSEGSIACLCFIRGNYWPTVGSEAPFPPKDLEQRQSSLAFYNELGAGFLLGHCVPLRLPWLRQASVTWTFFFFFLMCWTQGQQLLCFFCHLPGKWQRFKREKCRTGLQNLERLPVGRGHPLPLES